MCKFPQSFVVRVQMQCLVTVRKKAPGHLVVKSAGSCSQTLPKKDLACQILMKL